MVLQYNVMSKAKCSKSKRWVAAAARAVNYHPLEATSDTICVQHKNLRLAQVQGTEYKHRYKTPKYNAMSKLTTRVTDCHWLETTNVTNVVCKSKIHRWAQVDGATVQCNHRRLRLASITWITQVSQITVFHLKYEIKHTQILRQKQITSFTYIPIKYLNL